MRYLSVLIWLLLGVPAALVLVTFAVNNRQPVVFDLWPAPFSIDGVQLYLPIYLAFLIGGAFGAAMQWIKDGKVRMRFRRYRRIAADHEAARDRARRQVERLEAALEKAGAEDAGTPPAAAAGGTAAPAKLLGAG